MLQTRCWLSFLIFFTLTTTLGALPIAPNSSAVEKPLVDIPLDYIQPEDTAKSFGGNLKFVGRTRGFIQTRVKIGTPPKKFSVAVDTGSTSLFVFDKSFKDARPDQPLYDPLVSKTSKLIDSHFNTTSGDSVLRGDAFTDNFEFLEKIQHEIGSVRLVTHGSIPPADGVLGLGWDPRVRNVSSYKFPILNILQSVPEPVYQLNVKTGGSIRFGGTGAVGCDSKVEYVSIDPQHSSPVIDAVHFEFDSYVDGSYAPAFFESDLNLILVPRAAFAVIQADLQTKSKDDVLTVNCVAETERPPLRFHFNGRLYNIPAENYILKTNDEGICAVAVGLSGDHRYHFGIPFLKSYCVTFDVGQNRLGFSQKTDGPAIDYPNGVVSLKISVVSIFIGLIMGLWNI